MKFSKLASYLERLERTASRNEITVILAELFKETGSNEIDKITYLLSGSLAPNYQGINFNIAEKLMFQIIARAYGIEKVEARRMFKEKGDLGVVAEGLAKKGTKDPEAIEVYKKMLEIAEEEGGGSQERKIAGMAEILSSLDPKGARYAARIPTGNLRLGFSDITVLDALSVMVKGDKSARPQIETAFNVSVDIGKIAKKVKVEGLAGLSKVKPEAGTPIRPSLAERLPSAEKILEKVGPKVAIEPKLDGFRAQVHIFKVKGKKEVRIFSRNLENTTNMFPDLVKAVKNIGVESAIFDAEAIAFNPETGKFLPFQETAQRKRKYDIEVLVKRLPLKLFVFDILFKNGISLLEKPFRERRKILEKTVVQDGKVEITRQKIVGNPAEIRSLQSQYLKEGLEGALIKKIDAVYKAGGRGYHWVKYKKTTEGGMVDTIDCLVLGTYKGRGKRASFGVGAFLVGVKEGEKFKSVSKIGTGLTDEQWKELYRRTNKLFAEGKPKEYEVDNNLSPDSWTKPSLVVEILADEISKSPIHTAGLALRFPRLIRFRDEKGPNQATTLTELKKLFELQKS